MVISSSVIRLVESIPEGVSIFKCRGVKLSPVCTAIIGKKYSSLLTVLVISPPARKNIFTSPGQPTVFASLIKPTNKEAKVDTSFEETAVIISEKPLADSFLTIKSSVEVAALSAFPLKLSVLGNS